MCSNPGSQSSEKTVIRLGEGEKPAFTHGAKVTFHFETKIQETTLDDSRTFYKPVGLIIGEMYGGVKGFWSSCLSTMLIGEISSFRAKRTDSFNYPDVARFYRDNHRMPIPKDVDLMKQAMEKGLPKHEDLDQLRKAPEDLEFILELVKVDQPGEFQKEVTEMNDEETLNSVPQLKEEGNNLFKEKKYEEAIEKYVEALSRIDIIICKNKFKNMPNLIEQKTPLLLNYAQCKLFLGDFRSAIGPCDEVLNVEPKNVKALFRRGKAHVRLLSSEEATKDFEAVMKLDKKLTNACKKEIEKLEVLEKKKYKEDKENLGKLFGRY